jgi:molybdopterin/thiamine biosynthesis adenylyltransferase
MECDSEFRRLANRNRFVRDLEKQGYAVDFVGSHLVIYGLPYLDNKGELRYGDLASPVDLKGEYEIDRPQSHQVWFRGEVPYDINGAPLRISAVQNPRAITNELICLLSFSLKIEGRVYESFSEKITTYLEVLTAPARKKYDAVPQSEIQKKASEVRSPLRFPDTMSARDGVNDLTSRLVGVKVGIVGLGGTGSYILDFIAKTHVELIRLYDDDIVHVHTLFRLPGSVGDKTLGHKKVDVLYNIYSDFHTGIEAHPAKITSENVEELKDLDFVFIAVDDGPSRDLICRDLTHANVRYIDVGMGLYRTPRGLDGMIRIAGGDATDSAKLLGTPYIPAANPADNEYRRQPQIGELNALNAAFAVIRFKQALGVFHRDVDSSASVFEISTFEVDQYKTDGVPS